MAVITVSPSSGPRYDAAHRRKGRGRASRTLLSYGTQPAQRSPRNRPGWPTSYENVASQGVTARGSLRKPPARTGFPLPRVLRHTASQPAGRFVDWMVQRQTCAISQEVPAPKGPTRPMTNCDSVTFHSDYIPPPPTSPQVSARRVRPARWRLPELPGVFPADSAPPDQVCAFPQLTGLRPEALGIAKTMAFRYPH
jgi:hypothetical protein